MEQTPGTPPTGPTPGAQGPTPGAQGPTPPRVTWQAPMAAGHPPLPPYPPAPPLPGTSGPGRRGVLLARTALVVGAAAGLAVGAAALANAATSPSSPRQADATASSAAPTTTMPNEGPMGRFGRDFGGPFGGGLGVGGPLLYGTFTVQGPNGYETLAERSGTVSSVSNTSGDTWSLEVKSADGTSQTFVVDSGTSVNGGEMGISSVKQNDAVRVIAVVSGNTATAKRVNDETVQQSNGNGWMPRPQVPPDNGSTSGPSGTSTQTPT